LENSADVLAHISNIADTTVVITKPSDGFNNMGSVDSTNCEHITFLRLYCHSHKEGNI